MQNRFFLGGASPEGFASDFALEQADKYGFLLKGGPGTGKSTLMRTVAAVFADETVSVYHCASDPRSLDAVVLEERGVFLADATAPHELSVALPYVTGELVDMAQALEPQKVAASGDEIRKLAAENAHLHKECRAALSAVSSMQSISMDIGNAALENEKLSAFSKRLCKRLLPKGVRRSAKKENVRYRQCNAVTPQGNLLLLPDDYGIILLKDGYGAAACCLINSFAAMLSQAGISCILSRSLTLRDKQPVHLLLPECKLALLSEDMLEQIPGDPLSRIHLQRFYDAAVLRKQRGVHRFAAKNRQLLQQRAVHLLKEALAVHDDLERPYINAQDRAVLERITVDVCDAIRQRFPREYKM